MECLRFGTRLKSCPSPARVIVTVKASPRPSSRLSLVERTGTTRRRQGLIKFNSNNSQPLI